MIKLLNVRFIGNALSKQRHFVIGRYTVNNDARRTGLNWSNSRQRYVRSLYAGECDNEENRLSLTSPINFSRLKVRSARCGSWWEGIGRIQHCQWCTLYIHTLDFKSYFQLTGSTGMENKSNDTLGSTWDLLQVLQQCISS